MEKVACMSCGTMILPATAERNNGFCVPCSRKKTKPPKIYAGFWKRLGAYFIDVLIFLPLTLFYIWGGDQTRLFLLYILVPGQLFGLWFYVHLVKKYGGTPGKLIMNIRITKLNGAPAGYREALLRYSVNLVLSLLLAIGHILPVLNMSDQQYFSMDWMERTEYFNANLPGWSSYLTLLLNMWVWSEFIVLLLNKKRRAIHDYIAGTVVIHKGAEKHIKA